MDWHTELCGCVLIAFFQLTHHDITSTFVSNWFTEIYRLIVMVRVVNNVSIHWLIWMYWSCFMCDTSVWNWSACSLLHFSAYGEAFFLMLQSLIIAVLILYYSQGPLASTVHTAICIGLLSYVMSPAVPMWLVWAMQMSVMPLIAASRVCYFLSHSVSLFLHLTVCYTAWSV